MSLTVHISPAVERALGTSGADAAREFTEAALVELYRIGRLTHGQLAEGLGVSRTEADTVLRRHQVSEDLPNADDIAAQVAQLRKLVG